MRHLALKNLKGRKAYSSIIIAAVTVAVVMVLLAVFLASGVRQELENKRRMPGPDLAVVPIGNKAKGHIHLIKGPPVRGVVPAEVFEQLGAFPELEALTPQKHLGFVDAGTVQAALIAFDPLTDFFVQSWLDKRDTERFQGRDNGLLLGAWVNADELPASLLEAGGNSASMGGRLLETGTFMDTAVFIPRLAAEIAAESSWILLRLRQGVSPDVTANRLEVTIGQIEAIRSPALFKAIHDQLYRLLTGKTFNVLVFLTIFGTLLVTGALFALMTIERKREFGMLKAMGAHNAFIFKLIIIEAALLGSAGAMIGVGIAAICLLCIHTGIVFHEISPALPSSVAALCVMLAAMVMTVCVAIVTAIYPALAASRMEPYAAIRNGE
ncbi:MAG: ABC transporter permease [Desulfovibrionaceae bacterium]|nr:ABC transporter permease [Desulfovibrionaceae bacterium]